MLFGWEFVENPAGRSECRCPIDPHASETYFNSITKVQIVYHMFHITVGRLTASSVRRDVEVAGHASNGKRGVDAATSAVVFRYSHGVLVKREVMSPEIILNVDP